MEGIGTEKLVIGPLSAHGSCGGLPGPCLGCGEWGERSSKGGSLRVLPAIKFYPKFRRKPDDADEECDDIVFSSFEKLYL